MGRTGEKRDPESEQEPGQARIRGRDSQRYMQQSAWGKKGRDRKKRDTGKQRCREVRPEMTGNTERRGAVVPGDTDRLKDKHRRTRDGNKRIKTK